jgi:8-oxo-dGTP pyrophosphatase MutT (NUDIX family)
MIWKPDVTVAAVVEREGRFLLVEEYVGQALVINQPAGHLEPNESLIEAAIRETLEETAWRFEPEAISGVYLWRHPERDVTYLRVAFAGRLTEHLRDRNLDHGIQRTLWLSRDEILQRSTDVRSPLVIRCIDDYLIGARYPLDLLTHLVDPCQFVHSKTA